MKTSYAASIAFALTALAAGQAMAAKAPYVNETNMPTVANTVTSTKSRADVRAELAAAQRAGEIVEIKNTNSELPSFQRAVQSSVAGKSRAEVRAELAAAQAIPAAVNVNVW